jgi:hypothetical protein
MIISLNEAFFLFRRFRKIAETITFIVLIPSSIRMEQLWVVFMIFYIGVLFENLYVLYLSCTIYRFVISSNGNQIKHVFTIFLSNYLLRTTYVYCSCACSPIVFELPLYTAVKLVAEWIPSISLTQG